jgi:hypothetical protein
MNYRSSQAEIYKALRQRLAREGVAIGETADFPRVEIHSFIENAPTDKDGKVRTLSVVVESMSAKSYGHAVTMNEENLDRLLADGWHVLGNGFHILGIVPDQLTELTETLDTKEILYRQLQRLNITIWQN